MTIAYVLINCNRGSEDSVIKSLKSILLVKEVHGIYGAYDILAKIESLSVDELRDTVTIEIRKIEGVTSTLTLMTVK